MHSAHLHLVTFQILIWVANCDNFSSPNKLKEIISLINNIGQLPCPLISVDDVAMILWFKDASGTPIYSYDSRLDKEPRHLTTNNDWGLRLYFRVWPNLRRSPALIIKDIQPNDEGTYRCRVDYKNAPTMNYVMRLRVVQPPSHMEVLDSSTSHPIADQSTSPPQHAGITYLGPYQEGQNATLKCNVYGGKPLPSVVWQKDGVTIDSSFEFVGTSYASNELQISNLESQHSNDLYTCQASNNNESRAISHSVNLDVYVGVKEIDLEVPEEMTAGVLYILVCKAVGAYPAVKMEFWKMQKRLGPKFQMRSDVDNVTTYSFSFKPEILDDEESISCKAENPWLNQKPLVARRALKIKYTPVAILRFGQSKTANFTEGESLLMECHVKANPHIFSISWFHGDRQLFSNETSGVRISGMTLILTDLKSNSGGKYFCQAANVIGKATSNPLTITLNIAPKCVASEPQWISLALGESSKLGCYLLAWPPDLNFYWTLNRSNDTVPILPMAMTLENYSQGGIEDITLEDFDEYIFPITRRESGLISLEDVGSSGGGGFDQNSTSQKREKRGERLKGVEESEGGFDGNPTKGLTYLTRFKSKSNQIQQQEKELKPVDKKDGLKGSDGLIHSHDVDDGHAVLPPPGLGVGRRSLYGRWKAPEDSPDNIHHIHHQAILSYTIKSIDDYGTVACWAKNSIGRQLSPCIFHIGAKKKEKNQDKKAGGISKNGDLTRQTGSFLTITTTSGLSTSPSSSGGGNGTGILTQDSFLNYHRKRESGGGRSREAGALSKLPMTSGIILMALLIFIASFGLFLFFLVKGRRQILRMITGSRQRRRRKQGKRRKGSSSERNSPCNHDQPSSTTTTPFSSSSTTRKSEICASAIFLSETGCNCNISSGEISSCREEDHPLYSMEKDLRFFYDKQNANANSNSTNNSNKVQKRKDSSEDTPSSRNPSCFDLSSSTTFTIISSNQNDFPPPPTSITSTASTSHGYGSIEEDEEEEAVQVMLMAKQEEG